MKKFGMYCIIIVVALFIGFTTYYFVANKEQIVCAYDQNAEIKLNIGDTFNLEDVITHKMPHSGTTIEVALSNQNAVGYDTGTKIFTAKAVGTSLITITPSNTKFGPFNLTAIVGNGLSERYPIYISDKDDLIKVGRTDSPWTKNMYYELVADIYLTNYQWVPIPEFDGTFNGAKHSIFDMTITNNYTEAGFVGKLNTSGVIKNLTFSNAKINGSYTYAGIIAGKNLGTICVCGVKDSNLSNTSTNGISGMIAGANQFTLMSSNSSGRSAKIGMCGVVTSNLTALNYAGGITGENNASIIENSYAVLSSFNSTGAKFGGIVGNNFGFSNSSFSKNSYIKNTHSGVVSLSNSGISGAIFAENTDSNASLPNAIIRNYYTTNGTTTTDVLASVEKKTAEEMKQKSTYQTWDFDLVWKMGNEFAIINVDRPYTSTITEGEITPDPTDPTDPDPSDPTEPTKPDKPADPDTPVYPDPDPTPVTPGNTGGNGTIGTVGNTTPTNVVVTNGDEITEDDLFKMIKEMRENPSSAKVYTIKRSISVDMTVSPWNTEWVPIGTAEHPFTCQLITSPGAVLTFCNLKTENKYSNAGFFGYIGNGAVVSGLKLVSATIQSTPYGNAGAVAGTIATGAKVQNITILNSTINSNGNSGFIAGTNCGTISNVSIGSCRINALSGMSSVGFVAGYNSGSILNSYALTSSISGGKYTTDSYGMFGGISGTNFGNITNCAVKGAAIQNMSTISTIWLGGISGTNSGAISKSTVVTSTITASSSAVNSKAGGLAGYNTGTVTTSRSEDNSITAYYAGGLVASNGGEITQCNAGTPSSRGLLTGYFSGGLVSINEYNGIVSNCLVATTIKTLEGSGTKACGLAYKLEKSSIISHCFSVADFDGNGEAWADTDTPFRNIRSVLVWQNTPFGYPMGNIENCLIDNISGKKLQGLGILIDQLFWTNDLIISTENAQGADNFATFIDKGFDENCWNFVAGLYPTVK